MQQKHFVITASLLMIISGALATTGDEGYYDSWGNLLSSKNKEFPLATRSTIENNSSTSLKPHIKAEPTFMPIETGIYTQPISEHIRTLKIRAERAIKSDRLSEFKRILLHSDLKKYPHACEDIFKKIVSHWPHLRNGQAYLVRLENQAGYLPQLTEGMLCKQLANAYSFRSQRKTIRQISRITTFLALAKNMRINSQSHSALEYMQLVTKEVVDECINKPNINQDTICYNNRRIILYLFEVLQIPENPLDPKEAQA
jgi:hypothetical protein